MSLGISGAGGIDSNIYADFTAEQAQHVIQQNSGLGGVDVGSLAQATAGAGPELQNAVAQQLEPRDRGPYMQALNHAENHQPPDSHPAAHSPGGHAPGCEPGNAHPPQQPGSHSGPHRPGERPAHHAGAEHAHSTQQVTGQGGHLRLHVSEDGETMESIAMKYHMFQPTGDPARDRQLMDDAVRQLRSANPKLDHQNPKAEIKPGTRIWIPEVDV